MYIFVKIGWNMRKLMVVTGGTKGIGRAIVEKFAANHFDVVTCARSQKELQELNYLLKTNYPTQDVLTFRADMSEKHEIWQFAEFIKNLKRKVDVLINNAGYFVPGQIHSEEEGVLESMIDSNLYSAYHLTRALVDPMIQRRSGHIFNICSTASITPYTNGGAYCISKYALYGMTKVLREELKPFGIRVTAVLPGATLTASWEGVDYPPERFMKPEDVADAVYTSYHLSQNTVVEEILLRPQMGDIN
jgi:short-subunit dehydrogenase